MLEEITFFQLRKELQIHEITIFTFIIQLTLGNGSIVFDQNFLYRIFDIVQRNAFFWYKFYSLFPLPGLQQIKEAMYSIKIFDIEQ